MRALLAVVAVSSTLCLAPLARAADGVPCSFYGLNVGVPVDQGEALLDAAYADRLATTGTGAVRVVFVLDGGAAWSAAKLSDYDTVVDALLGAGIEPLGLLSYPAVPGSQQDWNDDPDGDGLNLYVDTFAETSKTLLSHFSGRIRRWEIWNEPNCWSNPDYAADPQNAGCTYVLPRVYARILAGVALVNLPLLEGKKISLTTGGLLAGEDESGTPAPGTDYLAELYDQPAWNELLAAAGRRYAWDYLGVHLYLDQRVETDRSAIAAYLDPARDLAAQFDDDSRFSITEIGWTTAPGYVSEEVQAANLTTSMEYLAKRDDVIDAHWYAYQDSPADDFYFGIVTETGAPKVALTALREVAAGCEPNDLDGGGNPGTGTGTPGGSVGTASGGGSVRGDYDGRRPSSCACGAAGPGPARGGAGIAAGFAALAGLVVTRATRRRVTRRQH